MQYLRASVLSSLLVANTVAQDHLESTAIALRSVTRTKVLTPNSRIAPRHAEPSVATYQAYPVQEYGYDDVNGASNGNGVPYGSMNYPAQNGEMYPAAQPVQAVNIPADFTPTPTPVMAANPYNEPMVGEYGQPVPTPAPGLALVPGLTCSVTSTSLAEAMVKPYCTCNNGKSRELDSKLHITNPCPATAFDDGKTMQAFDKYKWVPMTSNGYGIECEWGMSSTLKDGSTTTVCAGSVRTTSTPPTPSIRVRAATGKGAFVGQMTAAALSYNVSKAIVSACPTTTTPITACETMSIPGVPYPNMKASGGVGYGTFVGTWQDVLFENAEMLEQMANATALSTMQSITKASCVERTIDYSIGIPGKKRDPLPAVVPPPPRQGHTKFTLCNVAPEIQVQYYSGNKTDGPDDALWLQYSFEDGKMEPLDVAAELCNEIMQATDFAVALLGAIPYVGTFVSMAGKAIDKVVDASCKAIEKAESVGQTVNDAAMDQIHDS